MADLSLTPVATQIKPVPQMSIADMVGMARGAQAYRQAEQINPLELQQKQQAVRTGEIALGVEEQKDKERKNFQTFMSDPNNYMTDNRFDQEKFNSAIPKIMPLTGAGAIKDLTGLAQAQSEALVAKQNLTQNTRNIISSRLSLLGRAGVQDPNLVASELKNLVQETNNDPEVKRLVENAYLPTFGRVAPQQLPDALIKAGQSLFTPTQQQTSLAPTVAVTPEGRTVTTQPSIGAAAPTATIGVAGGLQGAQTAAPGAVAAGTQVAPGMRLPYAVRSAAQPYIPEPTEAADQAAGQTYRNALVSRQPTLATDRRNVEETIAQAQKIESQMMFAKGGVAGELERKIRSAVSSEDYKMLAKDLANLQISNLRALGQGGNTVAGMDLTKVASGDETVPPGTLIKIARRAQADMTNIDMQANGAEQFKNRFGDNNMNAFKQAWNANADTKIFEAINITRDVTDPQKRDAELKRLFPDEKSRQDFLTKYRNLKKLSETGSL